MRFVVNLKKNIYITSKSDSLNLKEPGQGNAQFFQHPELVFLAVLGRTERARAYAWYRLRKSTETVAAASPIARGCPLLSLGGSVDCCLRLTQQPEQVTSYDRVKGIERERERLNSGKSKTNTTSIFGHLLFQVEVSYVVTERGDTDTTYRLHFTT